MTVGGDSPGTPAKPPDPVDSPPATSFAGPVTCSAPTAVPADLSSPAFFCSAPAAGPISVQAERRDGAGGHRSEDGLQGLEGGRRSSSVPDAAKPAPPTAAATSDAHQAPVSEMQDIDSNSGSPSPPALKDPVIIHSQEEASFEARGPLRRPDGDLRRRCLTLAPRRAIVSSFAEATDSETRHQARDDGDTGSGGADDEADADGNGDVCDRAQVRRRGDNKDDRRRRRTED